MENNQPNHQPNNMSNHVIAGVVMIGLGVLFLLDNLGLFSMRHAVLFWPVILIAIGALKLVQQPNARGARVGGVLIVIGLVLLAGKLGLFALTARLLFPCILIGVGFWIITKPERRKDRRERKERQAAQTSGVVLEKFTLEDDEAPLDITAVLGAYQRTVNTKNFRGGEITSILGGCELDLRQASIQGEAIINVFVVCGGISIKVPTDWTVILQGTPLLGGFDERTVPPAHTDKRLVIRGPAILGGVEVRN